MTFKVDGLLPNIRTIVARFRENEFRQDMTFEGLIHFGKDEGDAARSRIARLIGDSSAAETTGSLRSGIPKPIRRVHSRFRS